MNHHSYNLDVTYYDNSFQSIPIKEVSIDINGQLHRVRLMCDPRDNLTNRQLKAKAWSYLKKNAIMTIS